MLQPSPAPPPVVLLAVRNPKGTLFQGRLPTLEAAVELDAVRQAGFGIRRLECASGIAID